jgi:6,7-dimethyl-8-ribityllumazine synthase
MARGRALVEDVLPVLESVLTPELDEPAATRLGEMRHNYADFIARIAGREAAP